MLWFPLVSVTPVRVRIRRMDRHVLRLTLEIDPLAEPLVGTLRAGVGPDQTFTGWTQLGHAVDGAIQAARRAADGHTTSDAAGVDRSHDEG